MKVKLLAAAALATMAIGVPAFAQDATPEAMMADQTIADIVVASASAETPEFSTLLTAVQAADPAVLEALSDPEQQLTVFAPTDAAFADLQAALGDDAFNAVLADPAQLTDILLFHVLPGLLDSASVVSGLETLSTLPFAEGTNLTLSVPTLEGQYLDVTQDADGVILVNGAVLNLEMVDIQASNGIIHVINGVLLPESRTIGEIVTEMSTAAEGAEFTTLAAAVDAAGLTDTVLDPDAGPFTVFAPTDAAFAAAFEALGVTAEDVLADTDLLTSILTYHIVSGVVHSSDLTGAAYLAETPEWLASVGEDGSANLNTLNGATLTFTFDPEAGFLLNDTTHIVANDIDASNGVIHVIDAVLLPPSE